MPRVVITLPAYRAEGTLAKTVADIPTGVADELIVVDDASPDQTAAVARDLGLEVFVHPQNRGYGGNQKTCYRLALETKADIIVLLHPDYQYDPKAVPLLVAPILAGDADMTFGSRFAGLGDPMAGGMPMYRFVGNRVTTTLENLMLGSRFTDLHSGLRAYTRESLLSLPILRYSDDFWFDSQLLVDAVSSGLRVVEVPIPTRYTNESSSIDIRRSLRYVSESLAYCFEQTVKRGRRGRRYPVDLVPRLRRGSRIGSGPAVHERCVLCGHKDQVLVYPANATGDIPVDEFSCTTEALGQHDDILQCRVCGHVSSRPGLNVGEILDNYARVTDPAYLAEEEARADLFSWFVRALSGYVVPGPRLLEIGSNVGLFLRVASEAGWNARGIEPSRWAVETGVKRYGVDLQQGTIEDADLPDRSADVVVMLDVLEHLVDPLSGLRRIRRALDDEGLLVLSTINLRSLHARLRGESWPWFIRSHLHYFSPETLVAMLRLAGFRTVEWLTVPRSFHLSYLAKRGGANLGPIGAALSAASRITDLRVPVGWLGDISFVAARPWSS